MISFHHPLDYVGPHGEAVPCLHYYNPKSALLILNKEERERPLVQTQFAKATERFTYLGVKITPEIDNIVSARHDPLVKGIEDILERWSSLPISMIGQINLIKMSILPKVLHLFQSVPLPLSAPFFNRLRRIITNFLWNTKIDYVFHSFTYHSTGGAQTAQHETFLLGCSAPGYHVLLPEQRCSNLGGDGE